ADVLRHAGDDVEDRRDRNQLTGRNRERAEPQQHGDAGAHVTTVTELEKVADGLEVVRGGDAADARTDPDREDRRSERGRADPPPGREPVAVAEAGGADRGS